MAKAGMGPSAVDRFKTGFFDRKAVQDALGKAVARGLMRSIGTIRKTAQRSMRYRKGTAPAGQPPYAHKKTATNKNTGKKTKGSVKGALLRELLFFAYEDETGSAVAGPVKLGRSTVNRQQEFGERNYPKRPFMKPALDLESPKLPKSIQL